MRISDFPSLSWRHRHDGLKTTQVDLLVQGLLDDGGHELLLDAFDIWLAVAEREGFRAPGWRTPTQAPHIESRLRLEDGARFELEGDALDYRAFQVLRNMLGRLRLNGLQMAGLNLLCSEMWLPEDPQAPMIDEDNEKSAYPPLHPAAALRFNEENTADSRFRRAVLSVREPVQQAHVDALREVANRWFDLLESGGFALPLDMPWDLESVGDTVVQFEECSMEITVLRFQASEQAWSVLANMIFLGADGLGLSPTQLVVDD